MAEFAWRNPCQCGKTKTGRKVLETPADPKPKPTATWSRSLPDNITPQRAVEQGHVQNASGPGREHRAEYLPIEESLIDYDDDCEVLG